MDGAPVECLQGAATVGTDPVPVALAVVVAVAREFLSAVLAASAVTAAQDDLVAWSDVLDVRADLLDDTGTCVEP